MIVSQRYGSWRTAVRVKWKRLANQARIPDRVERQVWPKEKPRRLRSRISVKC